MRYFSGQTQVDERSLQPLDNKEFASRFPQAKGIKYDSFSKLVGKHPETGELVPIERKVDYKEHNPSLHECSAKCRSGAPHGKCECSCGGKNHGVGSLSDQYAKSKANREQLARALQQ
jgi:hypothetical protein